VPLPTKANVSALTYLIFITESEYYPVNIICCFQEAQKKIENTQQNIAVRHSHRAEFQLFLISQLFDTVLVCKPARSTCGGFAAVRSCEVIVVVLFCWWCNSVFRVLSFRSYMFVHFYAIMCVVFAVIIVVIIILRVIGSLQLS